MESTYLAVIKVVGAGGGGTNGVSRMIDAGIRGVEFVAVNTDAQALQACDADIKLSIGQELTRGLGAGGDPEVGAGAATESRDEIYLWGAASAQKPSVRYRMLPLPDLLDDRTSVVEEGAQTRIRSAIHSVAGSALPA